MADQTDVSNALVALIAQAIYPNGTGQASAAGVPVKAYQGWPTQSQLDSDLLAGIQHATVFPRQEERNTTRYPKEWKQLALGTQTLTLMIIGQTVTVGGVIPAASNPHNMLIQANGANFSYAVQATDSLTGIATALATLIAAAIPGTTNTGPVITLTNSADITAARVGVGGTMIREVRRQEKQFQLSIWSDTPDHRVAVARVIDPVLADTPRLVLADQTSARLIYKRSIDTDSFQKEKLYRRDLFYTVEFATTQTTDGTQVIGGLANTTAQDSTAAQLAVTQTII